MTACARLFLPSCAERRGNSASVDTATERHAHAVILASPVTSTASHSSRAAWYGIIFVVNQSLYKWYDTLTLRCLFCARTTAEKQPPPRLFCFVCSFVRSAVSFGLVASSVAPCAASVTSPLARPVAVGSHNRPIRLHPSTAWSLLWLLLLASVRDGQMATAPIRPPVRSATRVAVPC
jgi:hypothetical protein